MMTAPHDASTDPNKQVSTAQVLRYIPTSPTLTTRNQIWTGPAVDAHFAHVGSEIEVAALQDNMLVMAIGRDTLPRLTILEGAL